LPEKRDERGVELERAKREDEDDDDDLYSTEAPYLLY
jgi:hypothetical protein